MIYGLDDGADCNQVTDQKGRSPLQAAAENDCISIAKSLLQHGANVNHYGGYLDSSLQGAAARGHIGMVGLLLEYGADVHRQGGLFGNALLAASARGDEPVVQILLEKGADPNARGGYYGSALQGASARGHMGVVARLLEAGASDKVVNDEMHMEENILFDERVDNTEVPTDAEFGNRRQYATDISGSQITGFPQHFLQGLDARLEEAMLDADESLITHLLSLQPQVIVILDDYDPSFDSHEMNFAPDIESLLRARSSRNRHHGLIYANALQSAAANGYTEIVKRLLDSGFDPNMVGDVCHNALQAAAAHGHLPVAQCLIDWGADPNLRGGLYGCAIVAAAVHGHADLMRHLIQNGAQLNERKTVFSAAILGASARGHDHAVEIILQQCLHDLL